MKSKILKSVKKYSKIALLLCMPFAITNCDDDNDTKAFPEENPLAGYLETSGFDEAVDVFLNSGDYEFGISFIPMVSGQINSIVARVPEANPTLRVTIWDFDTKTTIKTITANVNAANTNVTEEISPIVLEKDKEYMITMNTNDWYNREKEDKSEVTYPFMSGNISITGYGYNTGKDQKFPNTFPNNYYAGDASFLFQQIEE